MELSKNQKIWVGIVHFLPVVGIIAYFVFFLSFFLSFLETIASHTSEPNPVVFVKGITTAMLIMIATVLISVGIKIFDIIHLVKSNKNDATSKVLMWVLLFVFASGISEIIYFFLEILPDKKTDAIAS